MIEALGLVLAVVGVLLAFQAPRQAILGWLPFTKPAAETGHPLISVERLDWGRNLFTYQLTFRITNRNSAGTSALSRCIFLEVFSVRPHTQKYHRVFYGAPINQAKGESDVYHIKPKIGLWELFRQPRTFPPNEVEDFCVELRFQDGFAYAVRVGIDWFRLNDPNETIHRDTSPMFAVCSPAEPRSAPPLQSEYTPPISFVNSAVPLECSSAFERVSFGDPQDDAQHVVQPNTRRSPPH